MNRVIGAQQQFSGSLFNKDYYSAQSLRSAYIIYKDMVLVALLVIEDGIQWTG